MAETGDDEEVCLEPAEEGEVGVVAAASVRVEVAGTDIDCREKLEGYMKMREKVKEPARDPHGCCNLWEQDFQRILGLF